jgi:uncharacterized membrane protein
MDWPTFHDVMIIIQRCVSGIGILIIISGVMYCLSQYILSILNGRFITQVSVINNIRLTLGRIIILGLEFIVAGDLIGTTTTPDYYEVGILAIIVLIRTVLSFSINRELQSIRREKL